MKCRTFAVIALLVTSVQAQAQSRAYLFKDGGGRAVTRAVDAKGVPHDSSSYHGKHLPWLDDLVKIADPDYPYEDRARHHTGSGIFRLKLALQTGAVTQVSVLQSIGYATLDRSAVAALRKWRWRPGKWKEIEIPVTFTMAGPG